LNEQVSLFDCNFRRNEMSVTEYLVLGTGQNTSVLQARSTITTAKQKCPSGRNPETGWNESERGEAVVEASRNVIWTEITAAAVLEHQVSCS
jgi:hypothetical protein